MVEVSVVIPTYNRSHSVERAVNSALDQTLSDIEVIVVDDGSTDDTVNVVSEINDPRLTILEHEKNKGGSAARNTGINHSQGEYIAFLDSDDEWKPTKLERQRDEVKSRSSDWVGAYCDFKQKRSNIVVEFIDNRTRRPTGLEGGENLIDRILLRTFAHGGASTLFIESDTINEISGFDPSFQRYQDLEFLIRLLQTGKLAFVNKTLVYKYDTGNPNTQIVHESVDHFNKKFSKLISQRGFEQRVKDIQQFMLGKSYLQEGKFKQGLQLLYGSECPHYRDALGLGFAIVRGLHLK